MTQRPKLTKDQLDAGRRLAWQEKKRKRQERSQKAKIMFADGWSKGRIAEALGVKPRTVRNYLRNGK